MSSEPPLHLLVVDDSDSLRQGAARLLERAGYVVTTAASGAEALASLREQPPHLVLLDRRLPDIDGLEICRHLKADPATADILVIMVSGELIEDEAQASGLETGADGYIARPVKNRELLARVAAFARLARSNLRWKAEVTQRRQLEASLEERVQLRTRELTVANQKLEEARRAALNLMQDATLAQQRLARANQELREEMAERGRVEAALRYAQEQLVLAQRSAGAGMWDWEIPSGRIEWSRELFHLFGLDPDSTAAGFESWTQAVHPEDRSIAGELIEKAVGAGTPLNSEYRVVRPTGEVCWIQALGNTVYDAARRPLRMSGICLDITERRRIESALRESEQMFRTDFEGSPVGRCLVSLEGRFLMVNAALRDMLGYTASEFSLLTFINVTHPDDRAPSRQGVAELLTGHRQHVDLEKRYLTKSGQTVWGLVHVSLRGTADGTPLHFSVVIQDITARKQAEEAMMRALAEKEVLLKEVHHRVKNNLQVVSGLLELQAERLPDPQVRQALKESQSRIKSIGLVHEQLYQSAGLARLDFKAYVQSLVAHLFHANLGKGQVVHLDLRMAEVTLDLSTAVPCGLLINELVTNALKHAFPAAGSSGAGPQAGAAGGPEPRHEILLTWEDGGTSWRLTVGDNGPGLPAGFDWERTKSLGLRLVPLLARQLKGGVRLEPGPGCRFVVEFAKP